MKTITGHRVVVKKITGGTVSESYSVGKNAQLILVYVVNGSTDTDLSPSVHLVGTGASATIIGLIEGSAHGKIRVHTLQHHKAAETTSDLLVKSVLRGNSEVLYDGSIRVDVSAQKTDAYQRNENLLLDEHTHATSSPALEILANDVRCTHGAVVKTLDENELWYLRSRGIDRNSGRDMIATGFLKSALTRITGDADRALVGKKMEDLYGKL